MELRRAGPATAALANRRFAEGPKQPRLYKSRYQPFAKLEMHYICDADKE